MYSVDVGVSTRSLCTVLCVLSEILNDRTLKIRKTGKSASFIQKMCLEISKKCSDLCHRLSMGAMYSNHSP